MTINKETYQNYFRIFAGGSFNNIKSYNVGFRNPINKSYIYGITYSFYNQTQLDSHVDIFSPISMTLKFPKSALTGWDGISYLQAKIEIGKDHTDISNWEFSVYDYSTEIFFDIINSRFSEDASIAVLDKLVGQSKITADNASIISNAFDKIVNADTFVKPTEQELAIVTAAKNSLGINKTKLSFIQNAVDKEVLFQKFLLAMITQEGYINPSISFFYGPSYRGGSETLTNAFMSKIFHKDIPHQKKVDIANKIIELLNQDRDKNRGQYSNVGVFTADTSARNFKPRTEVWTYAYIDSKITLAESLLTTEAT